MPLSQSPSLPFWDIAARRPQHGGSISRALTSYMTFNHAGAWLAGAFVASLTAMGASRKIFGPDVVARRLVPHRGDIGAGAFFSIAVGACVELRAMSDDFGPGGQYHLLLAAVSQLGYLRSLIARNDLPPAHPHRLVLLLLVYIGLAFGPSWMQIPLQVASLWIVKLRLHSVPAAAARTSTAMDVEDGSTAAPFLKPKRRSPSPKTAQKKKPSKAATKSRTGKGKGGKAKA